MKKILRKTPLKTLFTILMLCVATSLMADTPTGTVVSGTIIDSRNGEALAHINVAVAGTMLMCETDAAGKYKMENLPTGELTLVVRATGYRTERRQISSSAGEILTVDFALERDEIALDEVVVSANRSLTL
ncbi:MAG: carboxypeptidase-like regulatory domain-containing protein, partial [Prevotella micans]|nr:carboxypeptidase-like regulatory domain-containing protein [Prevotella micans]